MTQLHEIELQRIAETERKEMENKVNILLTALNEIINYQIYYNNDVSEVDVYSELTNLHFTLGSIAKQAIKEIGVANNEKSS